VHEEDVELGEPRFVPRPLHGCAQSVSLGGVCQETNCSCLPSVARARFRSVVSTFTRTNITIASFVSRQPS
jgi:hypothetical protein